MPWSAPTRTSCGRRTSSTPASRASIRCLRCLRCDSWVGATTAGPRGPPISTGPRVDPDPACGARPLHDRIVLRLIAIDRVIHFVDPRRCSVSRCCVRCQTARALRSRFYRILAAITGRCRPAVPVQNGRPRRVLRVSSTSCCRCSAGTLHAARRSRCSSTRCSRASKRSGLWLEQALGRVPDVHRRPPS